METKDRSKQAQTIIKNKLSTYFTEEQLSYLDDLGIEILSDYFSNAELRDLQDATPQILKGFVDRNQKNEVKRRLTQIGEDELATLIDWYMEECSEVEEVFDPQSQEVIALEVKHKTMKNSPLVHWDGRFIVAIGNKLASTRTRLDGVVGYQSAVQVQDPSFVEKWSEFYDKRDELLADYKGKVAKDKAAHQKKVDAAEKRFHKAMDKHNQLMQEITVFNAEHPNKPKAYPDPPVMEEIEYVSKTPEFVEPERPEIPQFLPPLDTRWSDVETEVIPEERVMSSISNSDIIEVKRHIESTGYKKPVRKVSEGYKVDQFILRKVK